MLKKVDDNCRLTSTCTCTMYWYSLSLLQDTDPRFTPRVLARSVAYCADREQEPTKQNVR